MTGSSVVAGAFAAAERVVVVSPHFGDAALALGALIAAQAESGREVEVLTVFTGGRDDARHDGRRDAFADLVVRRAEDDRALRILGARTHRLGLFGRIFREPPPLRPFGLFHTPRDILACPEIAAVRHGLEEALACGSIVLAPLAIGNHVDHVLVALAALALTPSPRLLFYEDFPALSERCRRRHPVTRLHPFRLRDTPGWANPRLAYHLATRSLLPTGPDPLTTLHRPAHPETWSCTTLPTTPHHESTQFRALTEHRTDLTPLGGPHRVQALIHRSHTRRGGDLIWHHHPPAH
ncbi:PIG-L family deacetylase [Nocardia sp. NPDC004068]|uniref:PIG-L family deacetylase n=1 Tax=Nocardia sp. NPDC004068 TaxID=3364303 RepID=UPI0036A1F427